MHQRHPSDAIRLIGGGLVVVLGAVLAHLYGASSFELDIFRLVNHLPGDLRGPLDAVMEFGTLWAVLGAVAVAGIWRRYWLALALGCAGGLAALITHAGAHLLGRSQQVGAVTGVIVRNAHHVSLGHPSARVTVAAALTTVAAPYLPRLLRRYLWGFVFILAVGPLFLGTHLPHDIVIGLALGWAIGGLVNLVIGTPCHQLNPEDVTRLLQSAGLEITQLEAVVDDGSAETPYLATLADGRVRFVKALDREHRDAEALASIGRYLAYRHVEDEHPFASAASRIEHEGLLTALAVEAGVHAAHLVGVVANAHNPSVLVLEQIDAQPLGLEASPAPTEATITALFSELKLLHAAGIAHRHLSLDNLMVDHAGQPWIVGLAYAEASAGERARANDVAELIAGLALLADPEQVASAAVAVLGKAAVQRALPLLQPLALTSYTRRALHHHKGLLDSVRDKAADAVGVDHVALEPLTRIRGRQIMMLAGFFVALYVLVPQFGELQQTLSAARHANIALLVLSVLSAGGIYAGATLSLTGAVLTPLAFGRTYVTQLASSFSNKITPAGLGGMGVNVRYLQRSGVNKSDAVGAVALNSTVGLVVHIVALVLSAIVLRRVGLPHVNLPSGWLLLAGGAVGLSVLGIVLESSFGRKHIVTPTKRTAGDLVEVLKRPTKAVQVLGGALIVLGANIVALGVALAAFHAHASPTDIVAVYLGGSAIAAASPTPGKVGATEAALIAGLTAVGVASGPAVAGVLAYRLATFWLPILPGYLAFHNLSRRELL